MILGLVIWFFVTKVVFVAMVSLVVSKVGLVLL